MLQENQELKRLIRQLWDMLWGSGLTNPLDAIEQITYLLFIRRLDDLEKEREKNNPSEATRFKGMYEPPAVGRNSNFESIDCTTLRWSAIKQMGQVSVAELQDLSDEEKEDLKEQRLEHRFQFVRDYVFSFLKELDGDVSPFARSMANATFDMRTASQLDVAIDYIDRIFDKIDEERAKENRAFQDIQGDVYEMLLGELSQAGKNGQFRTPRHIINLIAELLQPQPNEKIADPACGSSGFLLGAFQYIISQMVNPSNLDVDSDGFKRALDSSELGDKVQQLGKNLYGFDIDPTMVRLGMMNLIMHGVNQPQVETMDTLSAKYPDRIKFDVVMANPPFAGNMDKNNKSAQLTLDSFKSELLFLQRIFLMLKDTGRAAVIVPQGVLFGGGKAYIETRKMIVDKAELQAVIALPSGVFKPYAGVATAILLFEKGKTTEKVWFYNMENDGRTLDDKRKPKKESDLLNIVEKFHRRFTEMKNDRATKYFFVNKEEITENSYDLSISRYKNDKLDSRFFIPPLQIIEKLNKIEEEIFKKITELSILIK